MASHLDDRRAVGAAVDALVRVGDAALAVVDDGLRGAALRGDGHGRRVQEMLVRAGREIGGPAAIAVLRGHIEHPDREVGLAVMRALATLGPEDPGRRADAAGPVDSEPELTESVVREDLEHATHALRALLVFEDVAAATLLCGALQDELELIRQRVLAAFSMRHGTEGFNRVVFQLAQRDPHSHALALEWLDVTLSGTERAAVALLELVQDRDGRWRRPWVKACAIYTASGISEAELEAITAATVDSPIANGTDEERIVHETLAGIHHHRLDLV